MKGFILATVYIAMLFWMMVPAMASEAVPSESVPAENEVTSLPSVDESGPTEVELLTSINTYLTYLFVFGAFLVVVMLGKLVYRFFNMFF